MPHPSYMGRHRPTSTSSPSHVRRLVVPLVLVASTAAGGLVIRSAGASELGAGVAPSRGVVAAAGVDARALAAARADGDSGRVSRDRDRAAVSQLAAASAAVTSDALSAADKAETASRAKAEQAKSAARAKAEQAKSAARAKAEQARTAAAAAALADARRWVGPVSGYTLTSGYGMRWGKMHAAQDFATPVGTPVHALSSGTVVSAGWDSTGYGQLLRIRYWDGTVSWMAHNSSIDVTVGETVSPGQLVAHSGNTGHSTGPHVHLEVHPGGGGAVPPMSWLAKHGVSL